MRRGTPFASRVRSIESLATAPQPSGAIHTYRPANMCICPRPFRKRFPGAEANLHLGAFVAFAVERWLQAGRTSASATRGWRTLCMRHFLHFAPLCGFKFGVPSSLGTFKGSPTPSRNSRTLNSTCALRIRSSSLISKSTAVCRADEPHVVPMSRPTAKARTEPDKRTAPGPSAALPN